MRQQASRRALDDAEHELTRCQKRLSEAQADAAAKQEFLAAPWRYVGLKLPAKLPPEAEKLLLEKLSVEGYVEQSLGHTLADGLTGELAAANAALADGGAAADEQRGRLEARARHLVDRMALALQASALLRHGHPAAAEAYCAARLPAAPSFRSSSDCSASRSAARHIRRSTTRSAAPR